MWLEIEIKFIVDGLFVKLVVLNRYDKGVD